MYALLTRGSNAEKLIMAIRVVMQWELSYTGRTGCRWFLDLSPAYHRFIVNKAGQLGLDGCNGRLYLPRQGGGEG